MRALICFKSPTAWMIYQQVDRASNKKNIIIADHFWGESIVDLCGFIT